MSAPTEQSRRPLCCTEDAVACRKLFPEPDMSGEVCYGGLVKEGTGYHLVLWYPVSKVVVHVLDNESVERMKSVVGRSRAAVIAVDKWGSVWKPPMRRARWLSCSMGFSKMAEHTMKIAVMLRTRSCSVFCGGALDRAIATVHMSEDHAGNLRFDEGPGGVPIGTLLAWALALAAEASAIEEAAVDVRPDHIDVVTLGPKDTLVLRHPGKMRHEAFERLSEYAADAFGVDQKRVLLLEEGMTLGVLRVEDREEG